MSVFGFPIKITTLYTKNSLKIFTYIKYQRESQLFVNIKYFTFVRNNVIAIRYTIECRPRRTGNRGYGCTIIFVRDSDFCRVTGSIKFHT